MHVLCYGDDQLPLRSYHGTEDEALAQAAADVATGRTVTGIFASTCTETPIEVTADGTTDLGIGVETRSASDVQAVADAAIVRLAAAEVEVAEARAALGY